MTSTRVATFPFDLKTRNKEDEEFDALDMSKAFTKSVVINCSSFQFHRDDSTCFSFETCLEEREQYEKWNLSPGLKIVAYKVEPRMLYDEEHTQVIRDFFKDPKIVADLQLPKQLSDKDRRKLYLTPLLCEAKSMSFFDCLKTRGILDDEGMLEPCICDYYDGVMACDMLRATLLKESIENPDDQCAAPTAVLGSSSNKSLVASESLFSSSNRDELLFHLIRLLVIGGALCQSDDNFNQYSTRPPL